MGFPCSSVDKESACSAGEPGSIPELGRSPGEGNGNHSSNLAWKISWTEEPVGLQSMGSQRVRQDWATNTYLLTFDGSAVKNPPSNDGDVGSISGPGRSAGEGNGNPLQYSRLGNPIVKGAWLATVHGLTKELDMTELQNNNNNNKMRIRVSVKAHTGKKKNREGERDRERYYWKQKVCRTVNKWISHCPTEVQEIFYNRVEDTLAGETIHD